MRTQAGMSTDHRATIAGPPLPLRSLGAFLTRKLPAPVPR